MKSNYLQLQNLNIKQPELKTEEGYSADIYPWIYMSAQCPHDVRTTSHEGYMSISNLGVRSKCTARECTFQENFLDLEIG